MVFDISPPPPLHKNYRVGVYGIVGSMFYHEGGKLEFLLDFQDFKYLGIL